MDRAAVIEEMEQARSSFRQLLTDASSASLQRRSNGTRWTNRQLLFHMLFGYLIVRTLLPLVRAFGRRPDGWSRRFATALNAGRRPFHVINYVGSVGGGQVLPNRAMIALMGPDNPRAPAQPGRCNGRDLAADYALSTRLGPLLPGHDERIRGLPLRHPTLRPPPHAADALASCRF